MKTPAVGAGSRSKVRVSEVRTEGERFTPERVRELLVPYEAVEFIDAMARNVAVPAGWESLCSSIIGPENSTCWEDWFQTLFIDDRSAAALTWIQVRRNPGTVFTVTLRQRFRGEWHCLEVLYLNLLDDDAGAIISAYRILGPTTVPDGQPAPAPPKSSRWFLTHNDEQGLVTFCAGMPETILGPTCSELIGTTVLDRLNPDDMPRMLELWMRFLSEPGTTHTASLALTHDNGSVCWCDVVLTNRLDDPTVGAIVAMVIEVEDRRRSEAEIRASERRFRALAEQMPVAVFLSEPSGVITYSNRRFRELLGKAESIGEISPDLIEIWPVVAGEPIASSTFERKGRHYEIVVSTPSTELAELGDDDVDFGLDFVVVASLTDVTDAFNQVRDLVALAETDALTGLANRRALERRLQRDISAGSPVFAIVLDLDGFKAFNDLHGHQAGDRVLIDAANRISALVEGDQLAVRFGGDEFVILASGVDAASAQDVLARVERELRQPLQADSMSQITASLGYAWSEPGDDPGAVIERADAVMYIDKRRRARSR